LFKLFLLPPLSLLTLTVIGYSLRRSLPRFSHAAVLGAILTLYLMSTPVFSAFFLASLQWHPPLSEDLAGGNDVGATGGNDVGAIVVLAAGRRKDSPEYQGDTVGALTLERLRYAARLHRKTVLPILAAGGLGNEDARPLAEILMDTLLSDFGVPVQWIEDRSKDTAENAKFAAAKLASNEVRSIYLVTHAWHMPRAKLAFERAGLTVVPAPTGFVTLGTGLRIQDWLAKASALQGSAYATHEWLGIGWYWVREKFE
jgi:uncharacterized SAM-binding protein YcdF (DUF218 family)